MTIAHCIALYNRNLTWPSYRYQSHTVHTFTDRGIIKVGLWKQLCQHMALQNTCIFFTERKKY